MSLAPPTPTAVPVHVLPQTSMPTTTLDVSLLNLVAHEMRAPITIFKGYLSMLRDGTLDETAFFDAVRVMETKAEELEGLAEILATAARLESADLPHQPIVFDIAKAVDTAARQIAPRAKLEEARLAVRPLQEPVWVWADPDQVARVLANLLGNALTHTGPKAEVSVEIRPTSPVEVAVRDCGLGIAVERQERIFERFSRFAEGGVNRPAGLGLGLSISRDLAELNGGELLLESSEIGTGSVFVLRLPVLES